MKNYVINLEHSHDRRENVIRELKKIGIVPDFFPAVYGKSLTEEQIKKLVVPEYVFTIGATGCALSHLNIYKDMIEKNIPYAIIFEDDISISDLLKVEIFHEFELFVKNTPKNNPIVLSFSNLMGKGKRHLQINDKISIDKRISDFCSHAYMINLQAAKNILAFQTPLKFEIDMWKYYVYLCEIDFFTSNVSLIIQNGFESEIGKISSDSKLPSKKEMHKSRQISFKSYLKSKPLKVKIKSFYLRLLKLLNIRH